MPRADPERVRKLLAELRAGDAEERRVYNDLILNGLRVREDDPITRADPSRVDDPLAQWAIGKGLKADLNQVQASSVDQKILANLTNTWTRGEDVLSNTFRNAWVDMENGVSLGASDETKVLRLLSKLIYYEDSVPTRLKAEIERAKGMLRAQTVASHALNLYRANYLDSADTTTRTKGPNFTNPVTDRGTIPVGRTQDHTGPMGPEDHTQGHRNPITSQQEREKIIAVDPTGHQGQTNPKDRAPLGLSERSLLEVDIANLAQRVGPQDFETLSAHALSEYDITGLRQLHSWTKNRVAKLQGGS